MKQLIENIDFYYNDDGLMVLTEKFHLDRGYCCGSGCRHCPYDYDRVPEPQRSQLRSQRRNAAGPGSRNTGPGSRKDSPGSRPDGPVNNKD